jgi:ElaB/YqjD/DUF883 family membrane-anchored ribosome-binding protein
MMGARTQTDDCRTPDDASALPDDPSIAAGKWVQPCHEASPVNARVATLASVRDRGTFRTGLPFSPVPGNDWHWVCSSTGSPKLLSKQGLTMNSTTFTPNDLEAGAARVADAVSEASETVSHQVRQAAGGAADRVKDASDYVRDGGAEIGGRVKDYLKANPSHALLGAVAVGFLLGRFMARD